MKTTESQRKRKQTGEILLSALMRKSAEAVSIRGFLMGAVKEETEAGRKTAWKIWKSKANKGNGKSLSLQK